MITARKLLTRSFRWLRFRRQYKQFLRQAAKAAVSNEPKIERFPILGEDTKVTGFDRHYVYHTAWAARVIAKTKPREHVDIASSLYFAAIASAFCPIRFYDFRPPELQLQDLQLGSCDLTSLAFEDNSLDSLSCMHVVEHIGLGRYGDKLDFEGDRKAIAELRRVTKVHGNLLFVVPVGEPRVQFNAHRIYSLEQVVNLFPDFDLREMALIPDSADAGGLLFDPTPALVDSQKYGCGCFWLQKK